MPLPQGGGAPLMMNEHRKMNKKKLIILIALMAFTAVTFINPIYPREQFLQHSGTVLLLIPLIVDMVRDKMPMSAFLGILIFAILHIIENNK